MTFEAPFVFVAFEIGEVVFENSRSEDCRRRRVALGTADATYG